MYKSCHISMRCLLSHNNSRPDFFLCVSVCVRVNLCWPITIDNSLVCDRLLIDIWHDIFNDLSTHCTTTQDLTFESLSQTSAEILNSRLAPSMCSSYICAKERFIFWGSFANMKGSFAHMYAEKFSKVGSLPTSALRIRNRALHMRKRDLHSQKSPRKWQPRWLLRLLRTSYLPDVWEHHICQLLSTRSQPSTGNWQKSPILSQKSPPYSQKSTRK